MATLKIGDLSVGDWVRIKDGNVTVDIISPLEVVVMNDYGNLCACKIEDIEPIPITAEILERNGWRILEKEVLGEDYEYNGEERVWDDENCSIEICEEKQGVFWYSWSNEYYMWRLKYVHQLQHLIRLAGIDKEINL